MKARRICDRCEGRAATTLDHIVVRDGKDPTERAFFACTACAGALRVKGRGHKFRDEVTPRAVKGWRVYRGGPPMF